jgi:hypothetical protein
MNFSTAALEHLDIFLRAVDLDPATRHDKSSLMITIDSLTNAQKFLIPSPGHMNVVARKEAFAFMRLPYPICAFEYSCPEARVAGMKAASSFLDTTKSTRRIALAYDCHHDVGPVPALKAAGQLHKDAKGILVQSIFYVDKLEVWVPSFAAGYVDESNLEDAEFFLDNTQMKFSVDAVPLMVESLIKEFGHLSGDQLRLAMLNDVADELGMAMRACLLLNTRNLKIVKAVEAPVALNKKRLKKNKPPFFEYHTLDIFVSDSGSRLHRKRVDSNLVRQYFANIAASRKWGTVIGHFKIRKTGMFFWNAHTRGSKVAGVVDKDYKVKPK